MHSKMGCRALWRLGGRPRARKGTRAMPEPLTRPTRRRTTGICTTVAEEAGVAACSLGVWNSGGRCGLISAARLLAGLKMQKGYD